VVEIFDLKGDPRYNGTVGWLVEYARDTDRFTVELPDGGPTSNLRTLCGLLWVHSDALRVIAGVGAERFLAFSGANLRPPEVKHLLVDRPAGTGVATEADLDMDEEHDLDL
jgi:hypothetical protein